MSPLGFRRRKKSDEAPAPPAGVRGRDLDVPEPEVRDWDERVAEMDAADPDGVVTGGMTLEHPDELVPYIDVDPSPLPGYDWTVGMYDEVRLFVDDDSLSDAEEADAFESRFAGQPGITAVMREDREIVHVAARTMSAAQIHAVAVRVIADAAYASARLRSGEDAASDSRD